MDMGTGLDWFDGWAATCAWVVLRSMRSVAQYGSKYCANAAVCEFLSHPKGWGTKYCGIGRNERLGRASPAQYRGRLRRPDTCGVIGDLPTGFPTSKTINTWEATPTAQATL